MSSNLSISLCSFRRDVCKSKTRFSHLLFEKGDMTSMGISLLTEFHEPLLRTFCAFPSQQTFSTTRGLIVPIHIANTSSMHRKVTTTYRFRHREIRFIFDTVL